MSRAARAVESARPGRDENVPGYCRFEIDKAIPRPHWPFQKNSCFPRARADEMFASRFLPRSPPGQDRCAALWAPKRESAFRSHRLVPPRSDIGGRCVLESRQSFVRQLRVGSALRRFLFSSLTSTIKTQLAKCDGDSGKTPRQTYARISSTLHKIAALTATGLKAG